MENKKPDLTNLKNIVNYVIYGLAGIVSVLWFRSNFKEDDLVASLQTQIKDCNEEAKEYRNDNRRLINKAYNLQLSNDVKDTMLVRSAEVFDSMTVLNLKKQTAPYLKNIKKLTK